MDKTAVRRLKANASLRWHVFKHNRKNADKILHLEEKFVLRNISPGTVLCIDGLSLMYKDIVPLADNNSLVNNIIVVNPVEAKYSTPQEIVHYVEKNINRLAPGGRLIFDVNLMFLTYDRLNQSLESVCEQIVSGIENLGFDLVNRSLRLKSTPGYGNLFLSFDRG